MFAHRPLVVHIPLFTPPRRYVIRARREGKRPHGGRRSCVCKAKTNHLSHVCHDMDNKGFDSSEEVCLAVLDAMADRRGSDRRIDNRFI